MKTVSGEISNRSFKDCQKMRKFSLPSQNSNFAYHNANALENTLGCYLPFKAVTRDDNSGFPGTGIPGLDGFCPGF